MFNGFGAPFRRRFVASAIAASAFALVVTEEAAAAWPEGPITIVVPYGPGAANDLNARKLADGLTKELGVPVVVENRGGAGGWVGTRYVKDAKPDGYTWLEHQNVIAAFGQGTNAIDFTVTKDLICVGQIAQAPEVISIPASMGAKNVKEFAEYVKAHPDKAFYGVGALGSERHMLSQTFADMLGLKMKPVAFNNGQEQVSAVAAGRTLMTFGSISSSRSLWEAGKLQILAYMGEGKTPESPQAPTLKEQGIDFESYAYWGIYAPLNTPKDIVQKMNAAMNKVTAEATFQQWVKTYSGLTKALTPEQFTAQVQANVDRVNDMMQKTGIRPPQS